MLAMMWPYWVGGAGRFVMPSSSPEEPATKPEHKQLYKTSGLRRSVWQLADSGTTAATVQKRKQKINNNDSSAWHDGGSSFPSQPCRRRRCSKKPTETSDARPGAAPGKQVPSGWILEFVNCILKLSIIIASYPFVPWQSPRKAVFIALRIMAIIDKAME